MSPVFTKNSLDLGAQSGIIMTDPIESSVSGGTPSSFAVTRTGTFSPSPPAPQEGPPLLSFWLLEGSGVSLQKSGHPQPRRSVRIMAWGREQPSMVAASPLFAVVESQLVQIGHHGVGLVGRVPLQKPVLKGIQYKSAGFVRRVKQVALG